VHTRVLEPHLGPTSNQSQAEIDSLSDGIVLGTSMAEEKCIQNCNRNKKTGGKRQFGRSRYKWEGNIVVYSLKARIVESEQPAVTMQRPVNNKRMMFSAQSVPMAAYATMKYVTSSLSNNYTVRETVLPTRSVPRCYKQEQLVEDSWSSVVVSCYC
jgi:hypothetical protein